jgi:predicted RNA-binding Zn-ribbon protein involved in translation (DUF1610 family)
MNDFVLRVSGWTYGWRPEGKENHTVKYRLLRCPICRAQRIDVNSEPDEVEFTCPECGGGFTAGEARRGHLYVEQDATSRRLEEIERRLTMLEARESKRESEMDGQKYIQFPKEVAQVIADDPTIEEDVLVPLYRELSEQEEAEFRQHARDTYRPGDVIEEFFHPIWVQEARKMNEEAGILITKEEIKDE